MVTGGIEEFEATYNEYLSMLEKQEGMMVAQLAISQEQPGLYFELTRWDSPEEYFSATKTPEFEKHFGAVKKLAATKTDVTMTAMQVSTGLLVHTASGATIQHNSSRESEPSK